MLLINIIRSIARIVRRGIPLALLLLVALLMWKENERRELKKKKEIRIERLLKISEDGRALHTEFPPLSDTIQEALKMPYFFLGKGKQATAYISSDKKYVLKLIRWPKRKVKQNTLLFSLGVASQRIPRETGLLAVCYGPSLKKQGTRLDEVICLNKKGKIERVSLSQYIFAVQESADTTLKEAIVSLHFKNDLEGAHRLLNDFFSLLKRCRDKEVIDFDGALIRNGNIALQKTESSVEGSMWKPLYIDIGKFGLARRDEITIHDIKRLKPLASWIRDFWPELFSIYKALEQDFGTL